MQTREAIQVEGVRVEVDYSAGALTTYRDSGNWRALVGTFISLRDNRESSRKEYTRTLSQYFYWLEKTGRLALLGSLTRKDILAYKDYLLTEANLSPLTVCSYLQVVRKFYAWTAAEKLYPNIATEIKTPRRQNAHQKEHLTEEKSSELLQHFCNVSKRDFAIVNLMLRAGLRTVEVIRADVGDIVIKGGRRILRVWGKGHDSKDNFVVLTDLAYKPIAEYLATRKRPKANEPLFTSTSHRNGGGRLTTRTISGICKDGLRAIGLDNLAFSAHSLRHTTGCMILRNGGSISDVQDVLRHVSSDTSQIYVKSIKEETRLANAPETIIDNILPLPKSIC